jgi:DNA-binding response OmpR family regulator
LPTPIDVDPSMWEKIVLNLLSNAFKFTFSGEVSVRLEQDGDHVVLVIADTGTGIGLALVRDLIKLHGGSVDVVIELGRGATFRVSIPAHQAAYPGSPRAALTPTPVGARAFLSEIAQWNHEAAVLLPDDVAALGPSSDARILVADDNADMRDYLGRILGRSYRVETVGDGEAALERILANPPDLVPTDVMMPKLDGFGLIAEIRRREAYRSTPVILLSARAGEEARIEGLQAGADEYLVKPFSARELVASVASQLELARLRRVSGHRAERDRRDCAGGRGERRAGRDRSRSAGGPCRSLRAGFRIHLAKPIDPAELVTTIAALAKRFMGSGTLPAEPSGQADWTQSREDDRTPSR